MKISSVSKKLKEKKRLDNVSAAKGRKDLKGSSQMSLKERGVNDESGRGC